MWNKHIDLGGEMLVSNQFFDDSEVKYALNTLLKKLGHYQAKLNKVNLPKKEETKNFAKLINIVDTYRGPLYFPYLSSGMGNGPYVECADGSVKLDFISGIGVHWSHGDQKIIKASLTAALHDTVMQGNLQQHMGSVELFEMLCKYSGMDYSYLTSSGVLGVENALKICFQYKAPAQRVLAFSHCFCGRTFAAAAITDKPQNRVGLPTVLPVDYVPFYDPKKPKESIKIALDQLDRYFERYPNQYACMKFELIQGEGGFNVGSKPFFKAIMTWLNDRDIPVYVDETQTFGRTTSLFAFQLFELEEHIDIVSIGKLSQVCATLYKKKLKPKPGLISQTFTSSTGAIEASKVIINELIGNNYLGKYGKIAKLHGYFARKFRILSKKTNNKIWNLRGVGSMIAFQVGNGDRQQVIEFIKQCYSNGLISFIAGNSPSFVRFLLPIGGVSFHHLDEALEIIEKTLTQTK